MNSHTKISQDLRLIAAMSVLTGSVAFLSGCSSEPESHVVSAPPPAAPTSQVVVTQPSPQPVYATTGQTANGSAIIVMQAPPAMQQEVVMAQPSSDHRWVPGYWTWRNSRYEWMAGHWELPPNQSSVWVAPRWERTSDGAYRFYEGYWN